MQLLLSESFDAFSIGGVVLTTLPNHGPHVFLSFRPTIQRGGGERGENRSAQKFGNLHKSCFPTFLPWGGDKWGAGDNLVGSLPSSLLPPPCFLSHPARRAVLKSIRHLFRRSVGRSVGGLGAGGAGGGRRFVTLSETSIDRGGL